MHISADQFKKVAQALDSGKITVESDRGLETDAKYDPDKNCINVLSFNTVDYSHADSKGILVHEAVHAIIDINQWDVTQISSEAAGYLAQVMYRRLCADNMVPRVKSNLFVVPLANVFDKCLSIIETLNRTRSSTVPLADCNELRQRVHCMQQYESVTMTEKQTANGI